MARTKPTTVVIDPALKTRIEAQAKRSDVGWTTMLRILANEALEAREVRK